MLEGRWVMVEWRLGGGRWRDVGSQLTGDRKGGGGRLEVWLARNGEGLAGGLGGI